MQILNLLDNSPVFSEHRFGLQSGFFGTQIRTTVRFGQESAPVTRRAGEIAYPNIILTLI